MYNWAKDIHPVEYFLMGAGWYTLSEWFVVGYLLGGFVTKVVYPWTKIKLNEWANK